MGELVKKEKGKQNTQRDMVSRSNVLIESKSSTSLFERKLLNIAIAKATIVDGELIASVSTKDIKDYLHISGNSIYTRLKEASKETLGHVVSIEDEGNENFIMFNVVNKCEYRDGVFTTRFTKEMKPHIYNLKKDYTRMSLDVLCSFKSLFTTRIYEILRTQYYRFEKEQTEEIIVPKPPKKAYSLPELKFTLNVVDANASKTVKRLVEQGKFEEALEEIKDASFDDWRNFRRKVLEVAKKELEESEYSEICFDYEPVKVGKGGKVTGVIFKVRKNPNCTHHSDLWRIRNEEMLEIIPDVLEAKRPEIQEGMILEVADIFGNEQITIQDIKNLIIASEFDVDAIKKAFKMAKEQKFIGNLVGWMRSCLEEKWYEKESLPKFKGRTVEESQMTLDLYQEYLDAKKQEE
ncbi:MAG: replication initiation protein [Tyzzerella sp.]|nr:replication initiation protein [Tyzzerella sp.]